MKVCIVGAGSGARSAAEQVRQLDEQAQIDVFSKQSEIGYAPCELPFVLRGDIVTCDDIFHPGNLFEEKSIRVHLNTEVTDILRKEKCLVAGGEKYDYDKTILSLGAIPSIPPIPGLDGKNEFTLSTNIADIRLLQEIVPKHRSAAIVGAGAIGMEIAFALVARGYQSIYLLDMLENILPASLDRDMADKVEGVVREKGIELIMPIEILSISSDSGRKRVVLPDRELEVDFVVLATGAKPNVEIARKAGIKIGKTGAVAVNKYLQTSDPDIYAAGDCMENWDRIFGFKRRHLLVTTSRITGEIAATNLVLGNSLPYHGTAMTFIIEIFGHQVGTVGFNERFARAKGIDVVSSISTFTSVRPRYGGKDVHCKLIADRQTGNLVGAQVISEGPIRGAIDELAIAISHKISPSMLAQIDAPYSPALGGEQVHKAVKELKSKLEG